MSIDGEVVGTVELQVIVRQEQPGGEELWLTVEGPRGTYCLARLPREAKDFGEPAQAHERRELVDHMLRILQVGDAEVRRLMGAVIERGPHG